MLTIILILFCSGIIIEYIYDSHRNRLNNVTNLFYEIYVSKKTFDKLDYSCTHYYKGRIKTLYPNGKERTIWKSESNYLSKEKCEKDTLVRYNILCDQYLNKNNNNNNI